jgi:ribonuclease P/MRP protein subunit RPP1
MKATDACIHPFPAGDSSVRRLALEAGELGFDSVIVPGIAGFVQGGVQVLQGHPITASHVKGVIGALRAVPPGPVVVGVDAGDLAFNRAVLGMHGIHLLRRIINTPKNSLDHVAARSAADKGIAIDIDVRPLWEARGVERYRALGKYEKILTLQRHYGFALTLSSNAASVIDLRSVRAIESLCGLFGMEDHEVQAALGSVGILLSRTGPVTVVE